MENKLKSSRVKESTKERCKNLLKIFNENFVKLDNGFVIFKERYLKNIYELILKKMDKVNKGDKITYDEILMW